MTHKRIFIISSIIIFLLTSIIHAVPGEKNFFWKVEGKGGDSYLLGSIHALKKDMYPLPPVIEDAFAQCDGICVEADISGQNLAKQGMAMLQKAMYTGEETLQQNVSPKTFGLAAKKFKALGMDISGFNKFKPWMAAMTITALEMSRLGFDMNIGIDKHFLDKAVGKKEIVSLEGIDFQINLLESFSKEEQESFLLASVLEEDKALEEVNAMVEAWVNGDAEQMNIIVNKTVDNTPGYELVNKKMLDDRNVGMVKGIIPCLESGKRYFVVVGAAHMVGKIGIVQLLKDKGYKVTQL